MLYFIRGIHVIGGRNRIKECEKSVRDKEKVRGGIPKVVAGKYGRGETKFFQYCNCRTCFTTVYGGHQMLSILSPDAFNIIMGAHCEGANNKCKVQTIIQDNGCLLFYHALA